MSADSNGGKIHERVQEGVTLDPGREHPSPARGYKLRLLCSNGGTR